MRKSPLRLTAGAITLTLAAASFANAQIALVTYDMSANPGRFINPSQEPATVAPGLTASHITRGPGVRDASLSGGFSADGWSTVTSEMDGRANALANGEFFTFSIGVEVGTTLSISNLDHNLRRSAVNGPSHFEWQYSLDGFTTAGKTIKPVGSEWDSFGWTNDYFTYYGRNGDNSNYSPDPDEPFGYMLQRVDFQDPSEMPIFELGAIEDLQNIPGGETVTFRLYGWGNDKTTPTNTVAFRNEGLIVNGTVIPEPSTYALIFGAAGLGAAFMIRRRRKST
ncbi:MAG TPA: PEP-CTERM sorting domain-containing protein [Opitutales bacterium]|nr:PEP-CTERM sorting domain-containing protein [Opitutales bacterium]